MKFCDFFFLLDEFAKYIIVTGKARPVWNWYIGCPYFTRQDRRWLQPFASTPSFPQASQDLGVEGITPSLWGGKKSSWDVNSGTFIFGHFPSSMSLNILET